MKLTILQILFTTFLVTVGYSQQIDSVRFFIVGRDNGGIIDTLAFGYHPNATFCLDPQLGEVESPPVPPSFSFRWANPRIGDTCFGDSRGDIRGMMGLDLRAVPQEMPHSDTFRIEFQPGVGGFPFTFSWSKLKFHFLRRAIFQYGSRTGVVKINMLKDSTHLITDQNVRSVRIILNFSTDTIPPKFNLHQNYRNPFFSNQTTKITFDLPCDAVVSLKVYNILGEEVAVLRDTQFFSAGQHPVLLEAFNLPSGVYFYSLSARSIEGGDFVQTRKMLCLR